MRPCYQCQNLFVQALYNELDNKTQNWFEDHLSQCPACQKEFAKLQATSNFLAEKDAPQPDEEFWKGIWNQVEPKLQASPNPSFLLRFGQIFESLYTSITDRKIVRHASVFGVLFVGIIIGRFVLNPQSGRVEIPTLTTSNTQFISAPLDGRSVQYLERSKMLLLSFSNFDLKVDGVDALNLSTQKKISQHLIKETEYLQSRSDVPSNKSFLQLMDELESFLLQIANLESSQDIEGLQIQLIQEGVEKQGLLFKINLMEIAKGDTSQTTQSHNNEVNI